MPALAAHAVLSISSAHLPDGEQRRRTYADQLNMRTLFAEGASRSGTARRIAPRCSAVYHGAPEHALNS